MVTIKLVYGSKDRSILLKSVRVFVSNLHVMQDEWLDLVAYLDNFYETHEIETFTEGLVYRD